MEKSPLNKTLELTDDEISNFKQSFLTLNESVADRNTLRNKIINANVFNILPLLPSETFDLIIADPPYNINKTFGTGSFTKLKSVEYKTYCELWVCELERLLKRNGSLYIFNDWRGSGAIYDVLERYFLVQNRITFGRDKGRSSANNYKNNSEDIWYCTKGDKYTFNADAVKIKKNVKAPYRKDGEAKDWAEDESGKYRMTGVSNFWTDIVMPFWSMPENTEHPTQKPEALIERLITASSNEGDFVFDPFLGSGTTVVAAKKLNRLYCGVDINERYCAITQKRLNKVN